MFPSLDWHHPIFGVATFLVGLCLGSFLNVCIYRIPLGRSVVWPGSHCAPCGMSLKWWYNLPVLSWLGLRGRCACGLTRISPRYCWVEFGAAVLMVALWWKFPAALLAIYAVFVLGLLTASLIDCDHFIIPDGLSLGGIVAGLGFSLLYPPLQGESVWWLSGLKSLGGAVVGGGLLWGVAILGRWVFRKEAMGWGDVKLLAAMGAFLGWEAVLFTVAMASILGSVLGGVALLRGGQSWAGRIPFGPYLSAAAAIWVLGGSQWLAWYWNSLDHLHEAIR